MEQEGTQWARRDSVTSQSTLHAACTGSQPGAYWVHGCTLHLLQL